jgi:hypothetical protein
LVSNGQTSASDYARLEGRQKILLNDWVRRENQKRGQELTPVQRYAGLTVSQRSTYEAITNALTESRLTNRAGREIGSPIDLITRIDNIAGKIEGEGGDKQYRLYVRLNRNALSRLKTTKTFHRGKDNKIFHREYPYNFRQVGKTPTMQISVSRNGLRADIDIDYQSSSFPAALFNGHLKASNSDVRPTSHYKKHTRRWDGLLDWWDDLINSGGPSHNYDKTHRRSDHITVSGARKKEEVRQVTAAIDEFLRLWLVQSRLDRAAAFAARKMRVCSDLDDNAQIRVSGTRSTRSLFTQLLREVDRRNKKHSRIDQVISAIDSHDPQIKVIAHKNKDVYSLGNISKTHYDHFICRNKYSPLTNNLTRERYGADYVSIFGFTSNREISGALIFLWEKERGKWKIVSFDILTH